MTNERVIAIYEKLIDPIRAVARDDGYAIGVHGSLSRDIDLIAVPWAEHCSHPAVLAEAIIARCREVNGFAELHPLERGAYFVCGCPWSKPHGRLGWAIQLGDGIYIDLAVMPPHDRA